jgi:hypothetical protein
MSLIDRTVSTRTITTNASGKNIFFEGQAGRTRSYDAMNAVVLHQTDIRTDARGNDVTAYDAVIAHFVILPNGTILQLRDLHAFLNNAYSRRGIYVEVVGDFMSDRGTSGTEIPRLAQICAGQALVRYLRHLLGGQLTHIYAHRQWTEGHFNCPGPHIWLNVGHWAEGNLGLSSAGARRNIPPSWENARFAIRWRWGFPSRAYREPVRILVKNSWMCRTGVLQDPATVSG